MTIEEKEKFWELQKEFMRLIDEKPVNVAALWMIIETQHKLIGDPRCEKLFQ